MKQTRRAVIAGAAVAAAAQAQTRSTKKVHRLPGQPAADPQPPLFSPAVSFGNLLFVSGMGKIDGGDFETQVKYTLDILQKHLENAGSSMEKVLKCNVFLADIKNYAAMNELYRGRFGANPPARTTIAPAALPFGVLVEMDIVAHL